jgi:hypothetical protein
MAKKDKTEKNKLKIQANKTTPISKTDLMEVTDVEKAENGKPTTEISVLSPDERQLIHGLGAKLLTDAQVNASVSIGCRDDKAVDLALKHGSLGLLDEFAATDAFESTLAPVTVALRNAVMTSFRLATQGSLERRNIELNHAFKGAGVLVDSLQAFDVHQGRGHRRVNVGNVNVESGGQAVVGNVDATRPQGLPDDMPNKRKSRAD